MVRPPLVATVMLAAALLVFCQGARPPISGSRGPVLPADAAAPGSDASVDAGLRAAHEASNPSWPAVDAAIEAAIAAGKMPGCVLVVGHHDGVVFERAYGSRAIVPERLPMTLDTVFDLASLTKPVATATSLMVLADRGQVDLDARAAMYVPELARLPPFTVRQLLLHTSGLPAGTPMSDWSTDRAHVLGRIGALAPKSQPGERFLYSDVGFVVLQEIVERLGHKSLAAFASEEVFGPLGMTETGFLPDAPARARSAPTEPRDGGFMQGEVHDPRAFALGGVAGHAGVFSTAPDLSRFARAMLQEGVLDDRRIFEPRTFDRFLLRHATSKGGRALGWDIDSSFATHRSPLLSPRAFGHGGYTGTALWIDPDKDLFVLFLSNRVHPDGKGAVNPVIAEVATAVIDAVRVRTGIDVLRAESFARLQGARVGLITNAASRAHDGTSTIDALRTATGVTVEAIFTPEHGLSGEREGKIGDETYQGIPVRSLYGDRFSPTSEALNGIDTLVFDLQDVGMRFYTFGSTMKRTMKVAQDRHLRFVVLDRPNPIGGALVQGPVLELAPDQAARGFVNYHALPLRHGLTMGELARLFVVDDALDLRLDVVPVSGWHRKDTFAATGLAWSAPSPNLRSIRSVELYPAIGLLESTNVSVGRGTDLPFEIVAAPWMDAEAVTTRLRALRVAGVSFEPMAITPTSSVHARKRCRGVRARIVDRERFEPIRTALSIARVLHEVHPVDWDLEGMDKMLRAPKVIAALRAGKELADLEATWAAGLASFKERRERVLLYR